MASLEEMIRGRRSIGKVKEDPVPRELIEKLIDTAVWAPNHHKTEPWKFIVMTGDGRKVLGQAYADIAAESIQDLPESERAQRLEREMAKAFRSPVVIAAICCPSDDPKVSEAEEHAAVHAAVQNLLLMAHDSGLGAVWRSGAPMVHPKMSLAFGLKGREQAAGLIYIGYPDMSPPVAQRIAGSEKTTWIEK